MYRPYLWFFADLVCDMFWSIWSALVVHIPIYFMIGLIMEPAPFFKYFFALYLYVVLYISIALATSASVPNAPMGNLILGAIYTLSYAFTGVTIPFPHIPRGWVWLFRFLPASHLTEALVMPQFQSCTPLPECSTLISVVEGSTTTMMPAATYASKYLGWTLDGYWNAIGWSVLFMAGAWALALFMITKVRFDKR
jgi:ABC-type multidrug transport system permease subunit